MERSAFPEKFHFIDVEFVRRVNVAGPCRSLTWRLMIKRDAPVIDRDLTGAMSSPPFDQGFTLDVLGEQGCLLSVVSS